MDRKLVLFLALVVLVFPKAEAEFWYNHVSPKAEELSSLGLKCIPGKTLIQVEEPPPIMTNMDPYDSSGEYPYNMRRSHMRFKTDDKSCQMCVCATSGKDEYCSSRPAMNVNECIRMATLMDKFRSNEPFSHENSLSFRIRRDYLWHNDEIPYNPKAKCRRGHSYYSNNKNANDTDIEDQLASDFVSLLDYNSSSPNSTQTCYFCVCSMNGESVTCSSKTSWHCEQYRHLRQPDAMRDVYRYLFKQDRPKYFQSLSWRLRRTMDTGMFDMVDGVGGDLQSCVPFVSEYTDCTEENKCSGCSKCVCGADSKWSCTEFRECPDPTEMDIHKGTLVEEDLDRALDDLEKELMVQKQTELENKRALKVSKVHGVPEPESREVKHTKNEYILGEQIVNLSDETVSQIANDNANYRTKDKPSYKYTKNGGFRYRRASDKEIAKTVKKGNGTVTFHNTLDEINEDTLTNETASGTIPVKKVAALPQVSRRTSLLINSTSSVQIGNDESHRNDNTVDTSTIHDDKEDLLVHSKLFHVVGNYTQETKDKELSKMLVNELKGGTSELIGEKGTPVISNITFYPENDTLTAMAFIAGNLLNKLWNMEKDASKDQIDTEVLKHEKISDLVELFKEPFNKRQELFLKSALDKLSTAINKHQNVEDISLCKNVEEIKKQLKEINDSEMDYDTDKVINKTTPSPGTAEALNKITGVLNLINKYENIQESIRSLNPKLANDDAVTDVDKILTDNEKSSLSLYGKTLQTITNLLVPKAKSKNIIDSLHSGNKFSTGIDVNKKIPCLKIGNLNVTIKDKIIMDYLEHIQSNPDCLLKNQKQFTPPSIEGDILLNLSEFFKIKSLSDLVRLVETEKPPTMPVFRSNDDSTAIKSEEETTTETLKKPSPEKLTDTKEKLKQHLKSVYNDLTEIKMEQGKGKHKDLRITDALPCLQKLFIDNIEVLKTENTEELSKSSKTDQKKITVSTVDMPIREIFSNLKDELKIGQTRRTNTFHGQRPKSALVWERVINNAVEKIKTKTRRNMDTMPKTIKELESMIEKFESWGSNMFKSYALSRDVAPTERLVVLKTFFADTLRYKKALETIHSSLIDISLQQQDNLTEIYEFVENAVMNLQINKRVVKNLGRKKHIKKNYNILPRKQTKTKPMREFEFATDEPRAKLTKYDVVIKDKLIHSTKLNRDQIDSEKDEKSTKLTKDQIINQLIKNRITLYIQTKEATGQTNNDLNFNIAEKILTHLEIGNFQLARELYKIFANQNKNMTKKNKYVNKNSGIIQQKIQYPSRRKAVQVEPLIDFPDTKHVQSYQDQFIKQLQNLRKMT